MKNKLYNRILSCIIAVAVAFASVPLSFFIAEGEFAPENLLTNGSLESVRAVGQLSTNLAQIEDMTGNRISESAINDIINGKESGYTYYMDALGWDPARYVGLEFILKESNYIGEIIIDAGYENREEIYNVYAADSIGALYTSASKVAEGVSCLEGISKVEINKSAKYMAIICTSCIDGGMRIKQIKVMSGEEEVGFVSENILLKENALVSSKAIAMLPSDSTQVEDVTGNRITADGITDIIKGKTSGYTYFMDALGWDPPKHVGLNFTFDTSYYIGDVVIDAGYESREEVYDIYISETESTLYNTASKVATGVTCLDGVATTTINKSAKFMAIVCTSCIDGGMRIKQIKVMTAEPEEEFTPENLLLKKDTLVNSKAVTMLTTDISQVEDTTGNRITADGIKDIINGKGSYTFVMDALGWDPPKYVGFTFAFDTSYYIGDVTIDAGYEGLEEIYDIYVSDSESSLYFEDSRVATGVTCLNGPTTVEVNKSAKYISFVCTSCISGGMRVKQIVVMSAQPEDSEDTPPENPEDEPQYDTTVAEGGKKVLTIGNSFSENASQYATEIAANQGYDLLLGYLKYSSATIEQHISNAQKNKAVYKFEYTSSKGRFTVKNGENSFASIKEALEFTDWDIIVLQQESTASQDFNTYLNIEKLVEYVKDVCPETEIMLHETWSWGVWNENNDERCYKIMANYLAVSQYLCDNAKIIHSGFAVEKVREHYNNHLMLNDEDNGNYQHLNSLGKYIAGATYVATIFGCDITSNTFGDSDDTFAALDLDTVRSIIADAVNNGDTKLTAKYEDYLAQIYDKLFGEPDNYISRHFGSSQDVVYDIGTGAVDPNERFNSAVANSGSSLTAAQLAIDGDTVTTFDVWGAHDWDPPKNVGVKYILDGVYAVDTVVLYAGTAINPVTIDVYAAKSGETSLFDESNLVGKGIVCSGEKVSVEVGAEISEVAFIITDYNKEGNTAQIAEFDLIGSEDKVEDNESDDDDNPNNPDNPGGSGDSHENNNFIYRHFGLSEDIVYDIGTGAVDPNERFNSAVANSGSSLTAAQLAIDGDTVTTFDVWGAHDWDPPKNVGVKYILDGVYKVDTALLYAGTATNPVTIDVYAAKSGETSLFDETSLVGKGIVCSGEKVSVEIGAEISEVAFIITDYNKEGNTAQIAEFDLTGSDEKVEDNEVIQPGGSTDNGEKGDNFIARHFGLSEDIVYDIETGAVDPNERFNAAVAASGNSLIAAQLAIDGDIATTFDVWGAHDWDPPKNVGVKYVLDGVYKVDTAEIYAGNSSNKVTVDVYAAKGGETELFDETNLVGKGIVCNGEKVSVEIGAEISEVAFIITDYNKEGNTAQIAEFNLTGSDKKLADNEIIKPDDSTDNGQKGDNFIANHLDSFSGIVQDVENGAVDVNERFGAAVIANGGTITAEELAIDGDTVTTFDVWGAHDWDPPKNVGVRYALDAIYKVDTAVIYAGNASNKVTIDVYAAKVGGPSLYQESNLVGKGIVCNGNKVSVEIGNEITEVAFIITDYNKEGNTAQIAEFNLTGSDVQIPKEEFKWPDVPSGDNILKNATAYEIIAPGGDFRSSKEYDYGFMDYKTETELSKLVDGDTEKHYDIWSLREGDKPGVLYDLGAYYDVSHVHAWAGVFESDLYTVNGYRIYASDTLSTLYQDENAVLVHENEADTTNEAAADVDVKKVRYIAFIITEENGGWKLRELAAYGKKSADQSEPAERESIIAGLDAEYYGVATDNLYDPIYMGASDDVTALVDGKRENVEFWGGNDVNNSCFVFIYNLYANYDLSDIEIFANADYMDTEFNVHKGIKSAKVYASRKFDGLFSTTPIVLKDGYAKENQADEVSSFAADALSDWKAARYVAFVFTIDDTQYGACRLEELKVYGTMSAVQDEEEEEARLPQYIDIEAENGVIARIFAMNATDDLSKLDAHLDSNRSTEEAQLNFINNALEGYNADVIYSTSIVDGNGNTVDTDGRFIRLSLPKESDEHYVACVDDFGAEIVSNGVLNNYLTVETSTLRSYALVSQTGTSASTGTQSGIDWLWAAVISLGVLAVCGIGLSVLFGLKVRKS